MNYHDALKALPMLPHLLPGDCPRRREVAATWLFWLNTVEPEEEKIVARKDVIIHPEWLDNLTIAGIRDFVMAVK